MAACAWLIPSNVDLRSPAGRSHSQLRDHVLRRAREREQTRITSSASKRAEKSRGDGDEGDPATLEGVTRSSSLQSLTDMEVLSLPFVLWVAPPRYKGHFVGDHAIHFHGRHGMSANHGESPCLTDPLVSKSAMGLEWQE